MKNIIAKMVNTEITWVKKAARAYLNHESFSEGFSIRDALK